jgi:Domain of unknown function (DUF4349)
MKESSGNYGIENRVYCFRKETFMVIRWGVLSTKSKRALKTGWLITAGLIALYVGVIEPRDRGRGIAREKGMGLAATSGRVQWEPISLWHQSSILPHFARKVSVDRAVVGGVRNQMVTRASLMAPQGGGGQGQEVAEDRKLVRTAALDLIVKTPAESSEKITQLAQAAGGFVVTSQVNGGADARSASVSIRVPAAKFAEVRAEIRKLGLRVDGEGVEAQDVTKQYVDQEARLRNLRAQEQQYLGILGKAATVKDTLEVSDKLNEVRGAIEERQAEFEALSKQVETVAINITLRAEADARVFGLNWRPLYQLKMAAREGLDGLGDYVASMTALVFYLPTVLLWVFTILAGAAIGWRILRWAARAFFGFAPKVVREQQA